MAPEGFCVAGVGALAGESEGSDPAPSLHQDDPRGSHKSGYSFAGMGAVNRQLLMRQDVGV